jgi:hypothetical protein
MLKKLERKIIYWKNYLLYGKAEAVWWDNFYIFADECGELLDILLRKEKGVAATKENKLKKEA